MRKYIFTAAGILVTLLLGASYLDIGSNPEQTGESESGSHSVALADGGRNVWLTASDILPEEETDTAEAGLINVPAVNGEQDSEFRLESVNGITLWDNKDTVAAKLGPPLSVEQDEFFPELEVLHYPELEIGIERGLVRYAAVPGTAGSITVDGRVLEVTVQAFEQALGPPDFVAEDGLVYQRGDYALKLYLNGADDIAVIRYFHSAGT